MRQLNEARTPGSLAGRPHQRISRQKVDISLHLPITTLAALSLASDDRVVGICDGSPMAINHARLSDPSLKPDLSEVTAKDTATKIKKLSASVADDFRMAPERGVSEDVTAALEHADGRVRDWSETAVLTLSRADHRLFPMSFLARAGLFGLARCTALVALVLAFFLIL